MKDNSCTMKDNNDTAEAYEHSIDRQLRKTRFCAVLIGLIVGGLIEGANLGGNWLICMTWARATIESTATAIDVDESAIANDHFVLLLIVVTAWTVVTALMGISLLCLLRSMVATFGFQIHSSYSLLEQHLRTLDQFYAIGTVIGIGLWWCVTDLLLVWTRGVYQSASIVLAGMLWYALAVCKAERGVETFTDDYDTEVDDAETDDESEEDANYEYRLLV